MYIIHVWHSIEGKIMKDEPNTEELVKEIGRLSKEIEYLATYKPSKEEIAKYVEHMARDIEEGIFRY